MPLLRLPFSRSHGVPHYKGNEVNDTPSTIPNIPRFKGNKPNLPIIPNNIKIKTIPVKV